MLQYQLQLPEPASAYLEAMLRCPVHTGTTIDSDGGSCAICDLNESAVRETPATYQSLADLHEDAATHAAECDWQGCPTHIELEERYNELEEEAQ